METERGTRKTRQRCRIDRLPLALRDKIRWLRDQQGYTWMQIEAASPNFVEWDKVNPVIAALFPGRRIPHTNLHRWFERYEDQGYVSNVILEKVRSLRDSLSEFLLEK